jgi:rhodanese-related sulfurtransferase
MVQTVSPNELLQLLATPGIDVIDVRDPSEWATGHIDGARLIPLEVLRADPDAVLARTAPIVFICSKGIRSMTAAKLADRFGYECIFSLDGGTKAWTAAGYALVTETQAVAA